MVHYTSVVGNDKDPPVGASAGGSQLPEKLEEGGGIEAGHFPPIDEAAISKP